MRFLPKHILGFCGVFKTKAIKNKDFIFSYFNIQIFKYLGRFAVAGRDITVGEVIAVEKAIVSHMLPEYMGWYLYKFLVRATSVATCLAIFF